MDSAIKDINKVNKRMEKAVGIKETHQPKKKKTVQRG